MGEKYQLKCKNLELLSEHDSSMLEHLRMLCKGVPASIEAVHVQVVPPDQSLTQAARLIEINFQLEVDLKSMQQQEAQRWALDVWTVIQQRFYPAVTMNDVRQRHGLLCSISYDIPRLFAQALANHTHKQP